LLQKLEFGCVYEYSTRRQSPISKATRTYVGSLKRGDPQKIKLYAKRAAQYSQDGEFPKFFGEDVTLVPIPG
jgi:hypothetical protein